MTERMLCDSCDHPIDDDHYYNINGEAICEDCMQRYFRKELDDE